MSLRVVRRMKYRHGEHLICERPDRSLCSVPRWMFDPECATFSLGQPAVAIEALHELRDLLTSLQNASSCDKASVRSPSQEDKHEIPSAVRQPATESSIARPCAGGTFSERTARAHPRSGRVARQRSRSKRGRAEADRRSE